MNSVLYSQIWCLTGQFSYFIREFGHFIREFGHFIREFGHFIREFGHFIREFKHFIREFALEAYFARFALQFGRVLMNAILVYK
ncbi:hypothetical protein [Bacillus sp. mrc49]|uniref:hypothetical protein n=1 Tax=Bacillus sp. mrc49 TaxID=2054913 RepID=UPI0012FDBECE|nr:hypothetical protein [Bacillus sp. mrc49]